MGKTLAEIAQPLVTHFGWNTDLMRLTFWDGSSLGNPDAKSTIRLVSPDALRYIAFAPGELGFARAYITGNIVFEGDNHAAIHPLTQINPTLRGLGIKTMVEMALQLRKHGAFRQPPPIPPEEIVPAGARHSKARDAKAISHHYDVGNEFYRMVLGPTMTYSCARYDDMTMSLDEAQVSKYDLVCHKLGLQPGMRMLDVGCGWGGLVIHAAQNYGVEAVGITLSQEQAKRARERVEEAGLSRQIEIRIQDYRDLNSEQFNAISSIGMFEHVGGEQMRTYFAKLHSLLTPEGRLLHHAIDKPNGSIMNPKGFIARYVFPDGELQDISTTLDTMQKVGFEVRDVESLREHYARTLRDWVSNLEHHWNECVALTSENRVRIWWMYMIGSAVSFEHNQISIHQTIAVKPSASGESGMPLTRREFV